MTDVRIAMEHPMESGQRKDATGALIAAWFIQDVRAKLNGVVVMRAQWGPGVSKNPLLQFTLKNAKPGDTITVEWIDNRGYSRQDEIVVG